jgi:hypothetical protein
MARLDWELPDYPWLQCLVSKYLVGDRDKRDWLYGVVIASRILRPTVF